MVDSYGVTNLNFHTLQGHHEKDIKLGPSSKHILITFHKVLYVHYYTKHKFPIPVVTKDPTTCQQWCYTTWWNINICSKANQSL